jgi:uncharacterized membrane protein
MLSYLVATQYTSEEDAQSVRNQVLQMQREELVAVRDAIVAHNEGGKVKLDQAHDLVVGGTLSGAFWGTLIGLLFGVPVVGLGAGMLGGAISGALADIGIDDAFAKRLVAQAPEGTATLLLLIETKAIERVVRTLDRPGASIVHTNLELDEHARLARLLKGARSGSAGEGASANA